MVLPKEESVKLNNHHLEEVTESSVEIVGTEIIATSEETMEKKVVSENTIVSMNLLLFTPDVFDIFTEGLEIFLEKNQQD